MPKTVFISYVYEDKFYRDQIIDCWKKGLLGEEGEFAFISEDSDKRPEGEAAIKKHIRPKIEGCAILMALIGDNSHNHSWVDYEIDVALSLNKKIIAVRLPNTTGAPPTKIRKLPLIRYKMKAILKALREV